MWEAFLKLDQQVLLALNGDGGRLWDAFFYTVSGKYTWIPLYLLFLYVIWRKRGRSGLISAILVLAIAVVAIDQLCNLFKLYTPKFRPSHHPQIEALVHTVRGYRGGLYGTVSSHTAISFTLATFTSLLFRKRWYTVVIFLWAALVGYSRIYLGVHFLTDVIFGAIFGTIFGTLTAYAYNHQIDKSTHDMTLSRQTALIGQWFYQNRAWMPYASLLVSAPIALLLVRPFSLTPDSLGLTIGTLAVSALGLAIRTATLGYKLPKNQFPQTGMYSRMRHPLYLGEMLMLLGPILYVGAWGYVISIILLLFYYYLQMLTTKERLLEKEWGNEYVEWCEGVPAFIPRSGKAWNRPEGGFSLPKALRFDYRRIFFIVACFMLINLLKERVINFSWEMSPFWMYGGTLLLLCCLLIGIAVKRKR